MLGNRSWTLAVSPFYCIVYDKALRSSSQCFSFFFQGQRISVAFLALWSIYVLYTLAALILNPLFNIHPTGRVLMGKEEVEMDSVGEEVSLWEKMMQYPDSWAEGTLPLRSTMKKGNWGQAILSLSPDWNEEKLWEARLWINLSLSRSDGTADRRDAVDWSAADPSRLQTAFIGLQGTQTAALRIPLTVADRIVHILSLYHV